MSDSDSSNFSSDEEIISEKYISKISTKENYYIIHKGNPGPVKTFIKENKKFRFPDDFNKAGRQIYSSTDKTKNIGPKTGNKDTILRFDSNFESGNLKSAFHIYENRYLLYLDLDPNISGSSQWFYFKMMNVQRRITYHFVITGFHKMKNLFCNGSQVFWYSEKQAKNDNISWTRGGTNYSYGQGSREKSKKKRASVQFEISFPYNDDNVFLCYSLPYTYTDLIKNISLWQRKTPYGIIKIETLCQTLGGRDCPLITITSNNSKIPLEDRLYICVTARIHPGESNGSYIMHGFIDRLLSCTDAACYLRDHFIFKIIPMLNIDGVIEGFYRISLSGNDLNRIWITPDPVLHPEIYETKQLFKKLAKKGITMYLDFHGHARCHGTFAYGCPNTDSEMYFERVFPRIFSFISEDFSWQKCVFSFPKDRQSAARMVMKSELGVQQSFTIETSFGGVETGPNSGNLYEETSWKDLGSKCLEAVYHYFNEKESLIYNYVVKELEAVAGTTQTEEDNVKQELSTETIPKKRNIQDLSVNHKQGTYLRLNAPDTNINVKASSITFDTKKSIKKPVWKDLSYSSITLQ